MAKEEWRDVPGFGGHYMASSLGRIRVKRREVTRLNRWGNPVTYVYRPRLLRPSVVGFYKQVHLGVDGRKHNVAVHRLVLMAFRGHCPPKMLGCHNDGNPLNNKIENLRWDTHHGNMQDRLRHGMYARGEHHPMAKLTNAEAHELRLSGLSARAAAARYGISKTQAYRILSGQRGGAA